MKKYDLFKGKLVLIFEIKFTYFKKSLDFVDRE